MHLVSTLCIRSPHATRHPRPDKMPFLVSDLGPINDMIWATDVVPLTAAHASLRTRTTAPPQPLVGVPRTTRTAPRRFERGVGTASKPYLYGAVLYRLFLVVFVGSFCGKSGGRVQLINRKNKKNKKCEPGTTWGWCSVGKRPHLRKRTPWRRDVLVSRRGPSPYPSAGAVCMTSTACPTAGESGRKKN